jgi:hypothetical protein
MIAGYSVWLMEDDNGQTGDVIYGKNGCRSMGSLKNSEFLSRSRRARKFCSRHLHDISRIKFDCATMKWGQNDNFSRFPHGSLKQDKVFFPFCSGAMVRE